MKTAWLITWEWAGDHAKMGKPIAAIINYRKATAKIAKIMELIYVNEFYSLDERLSYAKSENNNPYHAQEIREHGVICTGQIICGSNPFLLGRRVSNLRVVNGEDGQASLRWDEKPIPKVTPEIKKALGIEDF